MIEIRKASGKSICRYGCGLDPIKKGEPCLKIDTWGAGGHSTMFVCSKHAPKVFEEFKDASLKFKKLVDK